MKKTVQRDPEFVIYTGPMMGAKTSKMLAALDRMKYQSKTVMTFKPKMDHRYSHDEVVTHSGLRWPAICVATAKDIVGLSHDADVVAVDEAFMIDGIADVLIELFRAGKSIYVSSIQLSARGEPFEEMKKMFPWATKIEVCPAVCLITGRDAYYTVAKVDGLSEIDVGGSEKYEPRCHQQTYFLGSRGKSNED